MTWLAPEEKILNFVSDSVNGASILCNMKNGEETTSYFDCAEKLAAANIAASTSTLSWESKL